MEFSNQVNCLNCGNPLTAIYCGNCGQKKAQRITFKNFLLLLQRGTLELRSPLLKTIIGLTIRPADTCREYLDGRRVNYFNPVRYAFWLITFTVLLATFLNINLIDDGIEFFKPKSEEIKHFDEMKIMVQNGLVYFFFISAFIMALVSRLVFWKEKYNLFELYVVCLLLNGHLTFLSIGLLAIQQYDNMYGQVVIMILTPLYSAIVIARIYKKATPWTYIKSCSAMIVGWFSASILLGFAVGVTSGFHEAHLEAITIEQNKTEVISTNAIQRN